MDSNGAVILTIVASIAGALIAGMMTMEASKSATKEAFENSLRIQKQQYNAAICGVLIGLRTEIYTIKSIYEAEIRNSPIDIKKLEPGQPYEYFFPVKQNYFTVYETNAGLIGQIPDAELIGLIIEIYLRIKGIIDAHLTNNELLEKYQTLLEKESLNEHFVILMGNIEKARRAINNYGVNIRINYEEIIEVLERFEPKVDSVIKKLSADELEVAEK